MRLISLLGTSRYNLFYSLAPSKLQVLISNRVLFLLGIRHISEKRVSYECTTKLKVKSILSLSGIQPLILTL